MSEKESRFNPESEERDFDITSMYLNSAGMSEFREKVSQVPNTLKLVLRINTADIDFDSLEWLIKKYPDCSIHVSSTEEEEQDAKRFLPWSNIKWERK